MFAFLVKLISLMLCVVLLLRNVDGLCVLIALVLNVKVKHQSNFCVSGGFF